MAWSKLGNLKGAKGDQGERGERGEQGAAGKSMRAANVDVQSNTDVEVGAIFPADGIAAGDLIVDAAGDLYTVTAVGDGTVHVSNAIDGASLKGAKGDKGDPGQRGEQGERGVQGEQGAKGDPGAAFAIAKTFPSVAAMNEGFADDGVAEGQFVLIDTGNVEDVDNAKLYVKGAEAYSYLTDLSGAQGMTGPAGERGQQGVQGEPGAKGDKGADGLSITVGTGAPTGEPAVGTSYVDAATGDLYVYQA